MIIEKITSKDYLRCWGISLILSKALKDFKQLEVVAFNDNKKKQLISEKELKEHWENFWAKKEDKQFKKEKWNSGIKVNVALSERNKK